MPCYEYADPYANLPNHHNLIVISTYRVAFATYLLSIACFVLNIRWGAIYMLITGL